MVLLKAMIAQLIGSMILVGVISQHSGSHSNHSESKQDVSTSTLVNGPMSSENVDMLTFTQSFMSNTTVSDANKILRTYSIARPPLVAASRSIVPSESHTFDSIFDKKSVPETNLKSHSNSEFATTGRPEPHLQPKTDLKPEPHSRLDAVVEPESHSEPERNLKFEPDSGPDVVVEAKPTSKPETNLEPEPDYELSSSPEPETTPEPEPGSEPELNAQYEISPEPQPNPQSEPNQKSELNLQPEPTAKPSILYSTSFSRHQSMPVTTAQQIFYQFADSSSILPLHSSELSVTKTIQKDSQPFPEPESGNVLSNTIKTSSQNSAFKDEIDQLDEEIYSSSEDSSKPDTIDNEAIEELVNRFLSSDLTTDAKETKLNKEALKLINSSKYWNVDNLEPEGSIHDSSKAREWMNGYAVEAQKVLREVAIAGWNYVTSVSHLTKQFLDEAEEILAKFVKSSSKQAKQFNIESIEDPLLRRQFELLLVEGISALDDADFEEYTELQKLISKTYVETAICEVNSTTMCPYRISDIATIIARENNSSRALFFWIKWRDALSQKLAASYGRLIELINKGAKLNGFPDGGVMWRSPYELSTARHNRINDSGTHALLQRLYQQINPFYKQLHAYIRRQIAGLYGTSNTLGLTRDGPIPAHLLKSVSSDNWIAFYPDTKPFQENNDLSKEVQENLQQQNYTAKDMFKQAYKTLRMLGFDKLPSSFWSKSIFTRTWSKDMICYPPAAYDMRNGSDYRLKACPELSLMDFKLAHKLLLHIYYYYSYREQPVVFREPPNPSFLMAVTDAFAINAHNVEYLKKLKLITSKSTITHSRIINRLYFEALKEFVKLPFEIAVDMWRFHVFDGTSTNQTWNSDWWRLSELFQGIKSPVERKSTDFDAIAFSTVAQTHAPAIKQFFAYIMRFQILKALCPNATILSDGCVLEPDSVIEKIKNVMSLGSSITWRQALELITGSRDVNASAMLEYYQPLITWLEEENTRENVYIGWDGSGENFIASEIPILKNSSKNSSPEVLYGNQFAFPGGDCSNGRECLLESVCVNDICECREGLYTLRIGDTHSCVSENPINAGFGDNQGGLIIGLHPVDRNDVEPFPEPEINDKETRVETLSDEPNPIPESKKSSECSKLLGALLPFVALMNLL
ncbi:unnamed protein product [Thelazia callipaeda]|uniref:Angiotensin-converting enzyme n=1 Tax=Thelazia callipaeda TaxID=103827 RepID=A0A0N5CU37_THECL|nr:unnamed protein product [Thelazia callipaeda]